MRPDWDPITNLPFIFATKTRDIQGYNIDRIKIITSMSTLLRTQAKAMLSGRVSPVIIDEADSAYIAPQTRSEKGISMKTYIYVERHFDTKGPLMIYHRGKDIPTELRNEDVSHGVFEIAWYINRKRNIRKRVVSNPTKWSYRDNTSYFPIPLTMIPYHNQGFGSFWIDVDMQWINQRLNGTQEDVARQLPEILDEWEKSPEAKKFRGV